MSIEWEREPHHNNNGAWLTIGSFDGVHRGHQAIVRKLVEGSHRTGSPAIVVTFFPHPAKVLWGDHQPFYLTTPEEKNQLLKSMGVDTILTLHFDHTLASQSADTFIQTLFHQLNFSCLLVGYDFHLGVDNSGDIDTLTALSRKLGYQVHAIQPYQTSSAIISSSLIRDFIKNGDIEQANDLLGRPYTVEGRIVHGDARGRQIGMRTANLDIWEERLLPSGGVYAAMAESGGRKWKSVVNIGNRPTFYEKPVLQTVEAHLLDFDQDIYGKEMRLKFYRRIRAEKKFDNADQLMIQINQDIQFAREVLDNEPKQTDLSA